MNPVSGTAVVIGPSYKGLLKYTLIVHRIVKKAYSYSSASHWQITMIIPQKCNFLYKKMANYARLINSITYIKPFPPND